MSRKLLSFPSAPIAIPPLPSQDWWELERRALLRRQQRWFYWRRRLAPLRCGLSTREATRYLGGLAIVEFLDRRRNQKGIHD